jgi:MFS family permease
MACLYVTGFTSALDRKWFLSLPGVSEALTHRVCARGVCPTPDDRGLQQAFFSAPPAGRLVGLVVGAWILRRHGRRAALALANVWNIAAFATAAAAQSYHTLLVGSLMSEVSTGIFYTAVVVVDAELAPPNRRFAVMTAVVSVAMGLGVLNASCLALAQAALPQAETTWFWRVVTAFGAWPCMILLAIVPFVPESPLLQVQRGRTAEALQTLKDLRGPFADVKGEFSGIIHAVAAAEADDARLRRVSVALLQVVFFVLVCAVLQI